MSERRTYCHHMISNQSICGRIGTLHGKLHPFVPAPDDALFELATSFALSGDHFLERYGDGWAIRYERPGTMNPYYLSALPAVEPWQYKAGTRFSTRRAALDCLEARGRREK